MEVKHLDYHSYLRTDDPVEMAPWVERAGRLVNQKGYPEKDAFFIQPGWKKIGFCFAFDRTDVGILEDMDAYPSVKGQKRDDVVNPENPTWISTLFRAADVGPDSTVCILTDSFGIFLALIEGDPFVAWDTFAALDEDFRNGDFTLLFDETESWVIATSSEDFFFFACAPEIMDRFFDLVGGEKKLEYQYAILRNLYRQEIPGGGTRWLYSMVDWEMPFELVEGDGYLAKRDLTVVVPRDQEKICDHFNIPADERPAPPEYHESMYRYALHSDT